MAACFQGQLDEPAAKSMLCQLPDMTCRRVMHHRPFFGGTKHGKTYMFWGDQSQEWQNVKMIFLDSDHPPILKRSFESVSKGKMSKTPLFLWWNIGSSINVPFILGAGGGLLASPEKHELVLWYEEYPFFWGWKINRYLFLGPFLGTYCIYGGHCDLNAHVVWGCPSNVLIFQG